MPSHTCPACFAALSLALAGLTFSPATRAAPPSAPGLPTGAVSGDSVVLDWAPSSDDESVSGYNVYRDDVYMMTVPSARATVALAGTTTRFYVTAFDSPTGGDARGYSARSPVATLTRNANPGGDGTAAGSPDAVPADAPGNLSAMRTRSDAVTLAWTAPATAAGYNVYRDDRYLTTVFATSLTDVGVVPDQPYDYYVVAFDGAKRFSPRSGIATATAAPLASNDPGGDDSQPSGGPDTTPPGRVTGLGGLSASPTSLRLEWTAPADGTAVVGYNVYRNGAYVTTVRATSYTDTPAERATVESPNVYYIVAFDAARNFSPRSAEFSVPVDAGDGDQDGPNPPTLDQPFADAIRSPSASDPFGFELEIDIEAPVTGGPPTQPKNLRLDLVSGNWAEFSWAPSNDDVAVVAYEILRDDGVVYRLGESLAPGLALDPGTYEEYAKYWQTTSFIDCNPTRFAFVPGSAKAADAPWNCADTGPRPGDDYSYSVVAIDADGQRSAASEPISIAFSEAIDSPVPYYDDLYLGVGDRFASVTDLSEVRWFIDDFDVVFEDEFDAGTIDPAKWNTGLVWDDTRIINGEQQYFVDTQRAPDFGYLPFDFSKSAGAIDGAALTIEATPIPDALRAQLPPVCDAPDPTGLDRCEFLSGALSSHDRFEFIYGYVEGRIKASTTPGALTSFYLYHRYAGTGVRRHGPEIDILEYLGKNPFGDPDAFQTYHFIDPNTGIIRSSPTMNHEQPDGGVYGGEYHTFGVLWEPQLVVWYIDGREIQRIRGPQVSRQPMNIVSYLVTGSGWAPTPDVSDASIFPLEMGVDYIRVYQRDAFKSTASFGN